MSTIEWDRPALARAARRIGLARIDAIEHYLGVSLGAPITPLTIANASLRLGASFTSLVVVREPHGASASALRARAASA